MHYIRRTLGLCTLAATLFASPGSAQAQSNDRWWPVAASANGHYLVDAADGPFFWLGDTAWNLFSKPDRDDAALYLDTRARQGFTVVIGSLVSALPLDGGIGAVNPYGDSALVNGDVTRRAITDGSNPADAAAYDYWDHVDYIVDRAAVDHLSLGLLPLYMGYSASPGEGPGLAFLTPDKAYEYGLFLGQRYGTKPHVFWVLGGDNLPDSQAKLEIWAALAKGLTVGSSGAEDYSRTLITYHPQGNHSSSEWLAAAPWLDFHMAQLWGNETAIYPTLAADYVLAPAQPSGLGEGSYEDSPGYPTSPITAFKVRQQAYWSYFAGGYHTYGNTNVWHFGTYLARVTDDWRHALTSDGAASMSVLAAIFKTLDWPRLAPDADLVAQSVAPVVAMRSPAGDSALVYLAAPGVVTVHSSRLQGPTMVTFWIDPTTGARTPSEDLIVGSDVALASPAGWQDALLRLDTRVDSPGGPSTFTNGSFEEGLRGWIAANHAALAGWAGAASEGATAAVFNSGQTTPDGSLSQTFATTPGQSYRLSFDAGAASFLNTHRPSLQVQLDGAGTVLRDVVTFGAPGRGAAYVPFVYTFIANSAATTVTFTDVSAATVNVDLLLDHVRVESVASADEPSTAPPFANGSFENDLQQWDAAGNAVIVVSDALHGPTDGSRVVAFNTGQSEPNATIAQTFATVPGGRYEIAFDVGAVSLLTASEQRLQIDIAGDTTRLSETAAVISGRRGAVYAPFNYTFVADSATTTVTFIDRSPTTMNVDLLLDNVRVTPLPE